jgi:carbon-monoxide dehydrogenase medium subunit
MWQEYYNVFSISEALELLAEKRHDARVVAGATDLILEIERGVRKGINTLVDITKIDGLNQIVLDKNAIIHLGPLVTHNDCVASGLINEKAFPLRRACWEVGAPQIRNRGTIAGNLITASPANDTITPLIALDAKVTLRTKYKERVIALRDFYTGVRKTVMQPDELLVDISFPAMTKNQRGTFVKIGLRSAQAIAVTNAAVILTINGEKIEKAQITLGSVAPTIIHAGKAEVFLSGKSLADETIEVVAKLASESAQPIDDIRGTKEFRTEIVRICVLRALRELRDWDVKQAYPIRPVLLRKEAQILTQGDVLSSSIYRRDKPESTIVTWINGQRFEFRNCHHKTLLHLLREDAGLTGTKEGCAEGECGACTIFLDGMAVMSCLVPAPQAHGSRITTIEGLAKDGRLHPVQQAFIDEGAVQCGYCTPGFIMSATMLLNEISNPSEMDIKQAITGNLCRCTGYYSIVNAINKSIESYRIEKIAQ